MNYLVYPTEKMKLTQDHTEGNHNNHSAGRQMFWEGRDGDTDVH